MAFCKFSSGYMAQTSIVIDAKFLNDYLPYAPEHCLKVYLYGLLKCYNSSSYDNTIEGFEKVLNMSKEDIESAFLYWQDENLVQVLNVNPIEIVYLPVKTSSKLLNKFKEKKYKEFTLRAQEIISGREINTHEFNEYITLIESFGMEPDAMLMIMKYCVDLKGDEIRYQYILSIAHDWAKRGICTVEKVEEELSTLEASSLDLQKLNKALKSNVTIGFEHKKLYIKWTQEMGFELGTILYVAKSISNLKTKFAYEKLDNKLTRYFEQKLMSIQEIEVYENTKHNLFKLAIAINKALGLYYDSVENEVDTYIIKWNNMGYDQQVLCDIANFCFKQNIRTLDGMDNIINRFYKLGITTKSGLDQYILQLSEIDSKIKELLSKLNLKRKVNSYDRNYYNTWTNTWNMPQDVIDYATSLAQNKTNPMQYINQILSNWNQQGIKTLEKAKQQKINIEKNTNQTINIVKTHSYSSDEINALFDNLDNIEL